MVQDGGCRPAARRRELRGARSVEERHHVGRLPDGTVRILVVFAECDALVGCDVRVIEAHVVARVHIVVAVLGEAPVRIHCEARGDIGQLLAAWVRGGRGDPSDEPKRIRVDVIDRRRRIDVLDFLEDLVVRVEEKTAVPAGMVMMRGSPKNGQRVYISSVS